MSPTRPQSRQGGEILAGHCSGLLTIPLGSRGIQSATPFPGEFWGPGCSGVVVLGGMQSTLLGWWSGFCRLTMAIICKQYISKGMFWTAELFCIYCPFCFFLLFNRLHCWELGITYKIQFWSKVKCKNKKEGFDEETLSKINLVFLCLLLGFSVQTSAQTINTNDEAIWKLVVKDVLN